MHLIYIYKTSDIGDRALWTSDMHKKEQKKLVIDSINNNPFITIVQLDPHLS